MSTAPTVESCRALGTVDGRQQAQGLINTELRPMLDRVISPLPEVRATVRDMDWTAFHIGAVEACEAREVERDRATRLELACRGAGQEALLAYSEARCVGFQAEIDRFTAAITEMAEALEKENAAILAKSNRAERRKAKALERKAPAP
jgi:hypothetical protein